jgi:hypothetical protein
VVSNDEPECNLAGATFIRSDVNIVNPSRPGSYQVDKERKLALGLAHAAEFNADYVFCLDADDILSPGLSRAILRADRDLVVLRSGWIFDTQLRTAYVTPNFHRMCGSSLAFRPSLSGVPKMIPDFSAVGHEELKEEFWSISGHKQDPHLISQKNDFSLGELFAPLAYYRIWNGSLSSASRVAKRRTVAHSTIMRVLYSAISSRVEERRGCANAEHAFSDAPPDFEKWRLPFG